LYTSNVQMANVKLEQKIFYNLRISRTDVINRRQFIYSIHLERIEKHRLSFYKS